MFQPSSTANSVSVTQSSTNHTSTMRISHDDGLRTVQDLASDEVEVEEAEDEVESGQPDEREDDVSGADHVAVAVLCAEQPVDQPRLAPQLRRDPAGRVRNE